MNKLGYMKGNKETAKGKAVAKMHAGKRAKKMAKHASGMQQNYSD